jgi:hypothetical protein
LLNAIQFFTPVQWACDLALLAQKAGSSVAKAVVPPDGTFFDEICVTDNSNQRSPHPVSPQNPLGSNAVNETRQTWFVGSTQPGLGVPVQNDSLRRYTDHGIHVDIVSPVTQ